MPGTLVIHTLLNTGPVRTTLQGPLSKPKVLSVSKTEGDTAIIIDLSDFQAMEPSLLVLGSLEAQDKMVCLPSSSRLSSPHKGETRTGNGSAGH
ncbi:hypothetical protein SKAU_G00055130 [Synaphobranchus kaupii]|uniref:Uncharacterized protein n=1 Tax=Synaphobranchus kaupii TaxID=118154 RepID=A0A9Q1G3Q3_SYNKA|nr:hypothetical protein SKAU_G00055130 [Synaphobranchus kaupii]